MRPIKFRGRCANGSKYYGEWVKGSCVQCEKSDDVLIVFAFDDRNSCTYHVDQNTVGQFTGLHDKNGKEIYEGDIIQHRDKKVVVQFHRGAFGYTHLLHRPLTVLKENYELVFIPFFASNDNERAFRFKDGTAFDTDYCEIIGNIYDNPEFLADATGDD